MKNPKLKPLVVSAILGLTLNGHATVLLPVDAAAWDQGSGSASGTGDGGLISQTISTASNFLDTKGEPNNPAVWTSTSEAWQGDFQGQDVDSLSGKPWIVYDLGSVITQLDAIHIITNAEANRGFKDIEIYYSSDLAGNEVTTWASTGSLPNGAANVVDYDFTLGWSQLGTTLTLVDVNDGFGTQEQPSTSFDISGIASARYIGIRGLNSFNDDGGANPFGSGTGTRAGINQIAFTVVPEPTSSLLLLSGLGSLLLRRRR